MGYVFISYSTKNKSTALEMNRLLNDCGIETWMAPINIPAGAKYAQVISHAIRNASCFALMLNDNAQNSIWVAKEVERAVNYRIPIIPVQFENVVLNEEFELYISSNQIINVKKLDRNTKEVQELLSSIRRYVGYPDGATGTSNVSVSPTGGTYTAPGDMPQTPQPAKRTRTRKDKVLLTISIIIAVILIIIIAAVAYVVHIAKQLSSDVSDSDEEITISETVEKESVEEESDKTETTSKATATTAGRRKTLDKDEAILCDEYESYASGLSEGHDHANLRYGPSKSDYESVCQITNGTKVIVESEPSDDGLWTLVRVDSTGKEGWMRTDFIIENQDDCFADKSHICQPDDEKGKGTVYYVNDNTGTPLRLRYGPSTSYGTIATLSNGTTLEYRGCSDEIKGWYYVYCSNTDDYGWVYKDNISETYPD